MNVPKDLLYHPEHTWARVEDGFCTVGITDFAQHELGDIVFIEFPKTGREIKTGKTFGSVESAKSVSDLFSPVEGEVVEVNSGLEDSPQTINDDPYGAGWLIRVKLSAAPDRNVLLDADGYEKLTETA